MKRFHVHLGVPDLATSIRFYSNLFGAPPSVEKPDYAKWMLEDPRINFAISHRPSRPGLNHLGVQAEIGGGTVRDPHRVHFGRRRRRVRRDQRDLLLRARQQALDARPPGYCVGGVPHAR